MAADILADCDICATITDQPTRDSRPRTRKQDSRCIAMPGGKGAVSEEQDGTGRHRFEALGIALPLRPIARLAQVQEPGAAPAVKREAEEDWGR
jgi:hypothetical protein